MKRISRSILKKTYTTIAIFLVLFGFAGLLNGYVNTGENVVMEKNFNQYPLNDKNGIAVDSAGNIYIGESETGSIQVYDGLGDFLYSFSFPTGSAGGFAFGIDHDQIHIVTARTDSYFVFENGILVYSETGIAYTRYQQLQETYNMTDDGSFASSGKVYQASAFNTVTVRDEQGGLIERIHLDGPVWPFPIMAFWIIAAAGVLLIFVCHRKFFMSFFKADGGQEDESFYDGGRSSRINAAGEKYTPKTGIRPICKFSVHTSKTKDQILRLIEKHTYQKGPAATGTAGDKTFWGEVTEDGFKISPAIRYDPLLNAFTLIIAPVIRGRIICENDRVAVDVNVRFPALVAVLLVFWLLLCAVFAVLAVFISMFFILIAIVVFYIGYEKMYNVFKVDAVKAGESIFELIG